MNFAAEERTFDLKYQVLLQRADDMARLREGDIQEAIVTSAASAADVPDRCDETATATPETWLQCITSLQEAGLTDAADEERKLLAAAFPDFYTP